MTIIAQDHGNTTSVKLLSFEHTENINSEKWRDKKISAVKWPCAWRTSAQPRKARGENRGVRGCTPDSHSCPDGRIMESSGCPL